MNEKIEFLKKCDRAYHNTGKPLISDREYDILKTEAMFLFPNDPYFQTVGAAPTQGDNVDLPYVLGSLNKTKPDGSLLKWCKDNHIDKIVVSDKLDGVSIYAKYVDGVLVQASTRGDGYNGKDITEKVRIIQPTINTRAKGTIELRGEAVMTTENCESLGYSLPRSAVSGVLNGDDQEHLNKCNYITIIWYMILGDSFNNYEQHYISLFDLGLYLCNYRVIDVTNDIETILQERYMERKAVSKWDIDGLVVANQYDATVGEDYYPSNMCAFKVMQDAVETKVVDVEWNVSRTGRVVPTVIFEQVVIGGSKISRATGFNAKYIKNNNIAIGSKIGVVRSGDVIPYIIPIV